jgi:hypothetical protein
MPGWPWPWPWPFSVSPLRALSLAFQTTERRDEAPDQCRGSRSPGGVSKDASSHCVVQCPGMPLCAIRGLSRTLTKYRTKRPAAARTRPSLPLIVQARARTTIRDTKKLLLPIAPQPRPVQVSSVVTVLLPPIEFSNSYRSMMTIWRQREPGRDCGLFEAVKEPRNAHSGPSSAVPLVFVSVTPTLQCLNALLQFLKTHQQLVYQGF